MSIAKRLFQLLTQSDPDASPSLDTLLGQLDKELANIQSLILPVPESKPRTPFDSRNISFEQHSKGNLPIRQIASLLPEIVPVLYQMRHSAKLYNGKYSPSQSEANPAFLTKLEAIAYQSGATQVKYVKVPRYAIFRDKGVPYEYAVVFTVEMNKANMSSAPSFRAFKEVVKGYKNLAIIANRMAHWMRSKGFAAYPGTAVGGLTDYVHLAELAGMGAIGYHGLLITPHEGARLRINTIYTNIKNLPLYSENEHLWVRDFCASCKKCIRGCPVEAIYDLPKARGDGGMQCIDHDTCRDCFHLRFGCAVCLAICPFSQEDYETVKARFRGNPEAPKFHIPVSIMAEGISTVR